MRCIKCFSVMIGPESILNMDEKYKAIDSQKHISINYRELSLNKVEEEKISFIRSHPQYNMKVKLSMCCVECGTTAKTPIGFKVKPQLSTEKYIKNFLKSKF